MTSILLNANDPNRLLPTTEEIEAIKTKVQKGKCNKLSRILLSISEGNFSSGTLPEEAKVRCISLLPLCYEAISLQKIEPHVVVKAVGQFAKCGAFQSDQVPEEVVFIGQDNEELPINKHLLMIYSPVFTKLFLSGMTEATSNKVQFPQTSKTILTHFKHYIYNCSISKNLSLAELTTLYRLASMYLMKDLSVRCLDAIKLMVCHEHAEQCSDVVWELLAQNDPHIDGSVKHEFGSTFVKAVLDQGKIPYKTPPNNGIALSLPHFYLLNKQQAFAQVLKTYVDGLFLYNMTDLDNLGDLNIVPGKFLAAIEWVYIREAISFTSFEEIAKHFPNIKKLSVSISFEESELFLDTIKEMKQLKVLHLIVPKITSEKQTSKPITLAEDFFGGRPMFNGFNPNDFARSFNTPVIRHEKRTTYSRDECLTFSSEFIARLKQVDSFSVSQKCVVILPEEKDVDNITGMLKVRSKLNITTKDKYMILTP